jgi:hypothetical protein
VWALSTNTNPSLTLGRGENAYPVFRFVSRARELEITRLRLPFPLYVSGLYTIQGEGVGGWGCP